MSDTDVLICGAGPTGLVLALWLTKLGVRLRIVDKSVGPGTTSRALAVQARTLELYRQVGLAEAVVADGHAVPGFNLWAGGRHRARLPLRNALDGLTAYPYILILPQDRHERLLIDRLAALGVQVERETELSGFVQTADGIEATLRGPDGIERLGSARYLAGCDGAHSIVRKTLGIGFPGGTYSRIFYVADIEGDGPTLNGDAHINLDAASDFLAVFPLAGRGRARLVGTVLDDRPARLETLTFADIETHAVRKLGIGIAKVNWFSTYRVHHRVADRFQDTRAFLLGDAGHIHSPAGGQGMNTGIGDAINLAWKLAAVIGGVAQTSLLDSYDAERRGFARRLVATTDRVFTLATSGNPLARFWRVWVAPVMLPLANRVPAIRRFNFRAVSQIGLHYRHGPLAGGKAGRVRGGDRLPWIEEDGIDNAAPLASMSWQVHVYGGARGDLVGWCAANGLPLHVFPWRPACARAGFARDALYLIRPDTYVALADPQGTPTAVDRFLRSHGVLGV